MNKKLKLKLIEISKKYDLDLLVLFGSRVNDTYNKNSDYDLAYFRNNELSYDEKNKIWDDIFSITNCEKIDLIDLKRLNDPMLKKEIYLNGILIFGNKKLFSDLQDSAYIEYLDFEPNYKVQKEIIKKRLELLEV